MARFATMLYFRKIFLLNVQAVPRKGPLLLVCNHPSSFFEACILAVMLPRSLYFLTRGDFFKNTFFTWFLRQTHQIPIFRLQDGFEKLRNNPDTFAFCYQALKEKKAILIFPESWTILEKRLRPMQKGAARLALGALKYIDGLQIMPIGITFSNPLKFRSTVTIKCGDPIPVTAPPDTADERSAMSTITNQIESALRGLMIQIDRSEREPVYDTLQDLTFQNLSVPRFPVISSDETFPNTEVRLAAHTNQLSEEDEKTLIQKINEYQATLKREGLTDRYLMWSESLPFLLRFLLIPGTLLLILGKAIFAIPVWYIIRFLNAKIHKLPFYGAVKWVMGFYLIGPWCLLLLIAGYLLGGLTVFLIVLCWIMLGIINLLHFHDIGIRGFLSPLLMSKTTRQELLATRASILNSQ